MGGCPGICRDPGPGLANPQDLNRDRESKPRDSRDQKSAERAVPGQISAVQAGPRQIFAGQAGLGQESLSYLVPSIAHP